MVQKTSDAARLPAPPDATADAGAWAAKCAGLGLPPLADPAILNAIFAYSPYLRHLVEQNAAFAHQALTAAPDAVFEAVLGQLRAEAPLAADTPALMALLRQAKAKAALVVAIADISNQWMLEQVTHALTAFADLALALALAHAMRLRMAAGDLPWPAGFAEGGPALPELTAKSGFFVLAMGKMGAFELNYSSDIDLIALYDAQIFEPAGERGIQTIAVRMVQDLARILQERTSDGYVFRVDLRLRPDPGSTPVAISLEAAENYYQSVGQNWERAALIKARPAAGDIACGQDFLKRLSPFIWRRFLDYAAMQDIHAIKLQIHAYHKHEAITVPGHDVKLGRGGIREIEFFAQIQQLIAAGRDPRLRVTGTIEALHLFVRLGRVPTYQVMQLVDAYEFLRRLEHRLQMIEDEQTHRIPADLAGVVRVAAFMGFADIGEFERVLVRHLEQVQAIYDGLLGDMSSDSDSAVPIEFGPDYEEAAVDYMRGFGFHEPATIAKLVMGWQAGRYRATRTPRARTALMTRLPELLRAFAASPDADAALIRFDNFLQKLPAGVQLFTLFQANPRLFQLLADIMSSAPALGDMLARNSALLDPVLSPGFFEPPLDRAAVQRQLDLVLSPYDGLEARLDPLKRWNAERKFQIGVQFFRNVINSETASRALSLVAEVVMTELLGLVIADFARRHGDMPNSAVVVVAMGRLGSREMTFTSDIDLIFVYDAAWDQESTGAQPLPAQTYYSRLVHRFVNALTALSGEGSLYEVDMRLRPSGSKGPVAVNFDSFVTYQRDEAWTWERLALTRARVVAGRERLSERVMLAIRQALVHPRDMDTIRRDAANMRERMHAEFAVTDPWEVKQARGGLVDIEFLCQHWQLRFGPERPEIFDQNTAASLRKGVAAGVISPGDGRILIDAANLQQTILNLLRLSLTGPFVEAEASAGLKAALASVTGQSDFPAVKAALLAAQAAVRDLYQIHLGQYCQETKDDETDRGRAGA